MVHTSRRRRRHRRRRKTGHQTPADLKDTVTYPHHAPEPVQGDLPFELASEAPVAIAALPPSEPDSETVLYRDAQAAADSGEFERAVSLYQELLTRNSNHVAARNQLTSILDRMERSDGTPAAGAHDRPGVSIEVLISRGTVFRSLGRYREAERELRGALQLDSSHAGAHYNLGLLMSRRGLWSEAAGHLRKAIELDPGRAAAHFHLGEALNQLDDLEGALQAFQKSVELSPNDPRTLYGLGIVLDRLNRPLEAAQMYRRSREIGGT